MSKTTLTKEQRARFLADKARFDARTKGKYCIRCMGRPVTCRMIELNSVMIGVLRHGSWICRDCSVGLSRYMDEIRAAKREAERPRLEAEAAERKAGLAASQAENRARLNAVRAGLGQPPLEPKTPKAKKPGRSMATTAVPIDSTTSADDGSDNPGPTSAPAESTGRLEGY